MIVTTKVLLERAKAGRYAVPALNVDNLESVLGVLAACRDRNSLWWCSRVCFKTY